MEINDLYKQHATELSNFVKRNVFVKSLRPTEENSTSPSGTPGGNVLHSDYDHNPLSYEYVYK
ncbi:hypothetical protein [Fulvivirga sediminis]|uniref:Uncharacterized protein n=1 Tax=Fulvivirga sediminis TaxID=2803949 RepID=A0A937FAP3_9BACT|nr:hypothetical protein [Fulvivirga sediminis]MBL3657364.1 hypothetical protein [Fulvivirga sediminis]